MITCIIKATPMIKYKDGKSFTFLNNPNKEIQYHLDSITESHTGDIINNRMPSIWPAFYVGYVWLGNQQVVLYWHIENSDKGKAQEVAERIVGCLAITNYKIDHQHMDLYNELNKGQISDAYICFSCSNMNIAQV
jgi:hypothetical protein